MRTKVLSVSLIVFALGLGGCASAPKPPSCDGTNKKPVNARTVTSEAVNTSALVQEKNCKPA
jgi:starvation-inducible outer membrane lipoprotein